VTTTTATTQQHSFGDDGNDNDGSNLTFGSNLPHCISTQHSSLGDRGDGPCRPPFSINIIIADRGLPLAQVLCVDTRETIVNMSRRCCCCGPNAVQKSRLDRYLSSSIKDCRIQHERIIQCTNPKCNGIQYFSCAMLFMDRVIQKVPRYVANTHPWVLALQQYYENQSCDYMPNVIEVPCCISCSLSIVIPEGMKPSLLPIMAPIPVTVDKCKPIIVAECINSSNLNENVHEYYDNNAEEDNVNHNNNNNDDDDDDDYADPVSPLLSASKRKRLIAAGVKEMMNLPSSNCDTLAFLGGYQELCGTTPPDYKRWVSRTLQKAHRQKAHRHKSASHDYTPVSYSNELEGALYMPSHNLIVCGYSDNRQLYSDIHGMANSDFDGSPSVPHMVLTCEDAVSTMEYHKLNRTKIKYITQDMFSTHPLHNVPMPQDGMIKRSWNVAHIVLPQTMGLDEVNKSTASTHVSAEVLANCQVYSWQRIHSAADVVIFVGDFGKEDNNDTIHCHKLLVARMQSIITKSISDDDVKSMYSNIALLAGRKGYEVTRTSGTGGITCPQSHADLLFVLHENDALLPNRAGKNCTV